MASTSAPAQPPASHRWLLRARDENATLGRRPLGEREQVSALLAECLPRLTFDAAGKGTYTRGKAELTVQLVGRPVTAVELTMRVEHISAFRPALERLTTKGAWQLFDPDRGEVVYPPEAVASPRPSGRGGAPLRWVVPALAVVGLVAWAGGWIPGRSRGQAASRAAGGGLAASPEAVEKTLQNMLSGMAAGESGTAAAPMDAQRSAAAIVMQVQVVGEFLRRNKMVLPEFRTMPVVNELIMISVVETAFRMGAGGGRFVDPAVLANRSINPAGTGLPVLPEAFAAAERGGYRFAFTGSDEGPAALPQFKPAYDSFIYVAWPESGQPHTFALRSDTGHIHYTTDGRSPTATDPTVVDVAGGETSR